MAAALMLLTAGCGGGEQFEVVPVSGRVTFNGKPLPGGGTISFVPTGEREGKAAGGEIKPDGTYVLSTYAEGDGALLGPHRVEVRQNLTLEPAVWPDVPEGEEPPADFKPVKPEVQVPVHDRTPELYAGSESPLTATVDQETDELNFDLKPQ